MATNAATFAVPNILDDLEVHDQPSNTFKEAYEKAVLIRESLDGDIHRDPKNIDGKARVITLNSGPYTFTSSTWDFAVSVDGGTEQSQALATSTDLIKTAAEVVDSINSGITGIRASVVTIEGDGYVLVETKSSGSSSSLVFDATNTCAEVLGISDGTYVSELNAFNSEKTTLLNSLDDIILDLRNISGMLLKVKKIHQLEFIEHGLERSVIGREIAKEIRPD